MMNKKLMFACALALVFDLSACGGKEPAASSGAASSSAVTADDAQPDSPAASAPVLEGEAGEPTAPGEDAASSAEPEKAPAEQPARVHAARSD